MVGKDEKSSNETTKRGGRPKSTGVTNSKLYHGEPYGMSPQEYENIVCFLNSRVSAPIYPEDIAGGSSRITGDKKKLQVARKKSRRKDFKIST